MIGSHKSTMFVYLMKPPRDTRSIDRPTAAFFFAPNTIILNNNNNNNNNNDVRDTIDASEREHIRARRQFRQRHKTSSGRHQLGCNGRAHQRRQIRCNGRHTRLDVLHNNKHVVQHICHAIHDAFTCKIFCLAASNSKATSHAYDDTHDEKRTAAQARSFTSTTLLNWSGANAVPLDVVAVTDTTIIVLAGNSSVKSICVKSN